MLFPVQIGTGSVGDLFKEYMGPDGLPTGVAGALPIAQRSTCILERLINHKSGAYASETLVTEIWRITWRRVMFRS